MISDPVSAQRAIWVACAQDAFSAAPTDLAPAIDLRMAAAWILLGHFVALDESRRRAALGVPVCYGFLAQNKTDPMQYVAVIRGTGDTPEWMADADFPPTTHPVAGKVEAGFWGIYASMLYVPLVGTPSPVAEGIAAEIGPQGTVVIAGHSLGSPLSAYTAFDLAGIIGDRIEVTMLASPQPGDSTFGHAFAARVKRYKVTNRVVDIVPHVPFGLDYAALPDAVWTWPKDEQVRVKFGPFCNHHVEVYAAILHRASVGPLDVIPIDLDNLACIKGPA
jgi:Lipase (class 3)